MKRYLLNKDFFQSNNFVCKPVFEVSSKIDNDTSNKIIVLGGKGVGKSVLLANHEFSKLNTPNQCINISFESTGLYPKIDNIFNQEFYNQYYESVLAYKMLYYIKKHCDMSKLNKKDLKIINFIEQKLQSSCSEQTKYVHNSAIGDYVELPKILIPKEITDILLTTIKKTFNLDSFTLAIDRFDWTNGNSAISQEILSNYFDMFDKVIITTDDESLLKKNNREYLINKGYSFIDLEYSKDPIFVQKVIKNDLDKYNQNIANFNFDYEKIERDTFENITKATNGNLKLVKDAVKYAYDTYQWESARINVNECLDLATTEAITQNKQLKKIIKTPKLYL